MSLVILLVFQSVAMGQISHARHHDNMNHEIQDMNHEFQDGVGEMRDETDHLEDRVRDQMQGSLNDLYDRIQEQVARGTTKRPDYIY